MDVGGNNRKEPNNVRLAVNSGEFLRFLAVKIITAFTGIHFFKPHSTGRVEQNFSPHSAGSAEIFFQRIMLVAVKNVLSPLKR